MTASAKQKHDPIVLARLLGQLGDRETISKQCASLGEVLAEFLPDIFASELGFDVEGQDQAVRRGARFDQVERSFVRREGEAVWAPHILRDDRERAAFAVDAVDVLRQFRLRLSTFVITGDAEDGVGEPDRTVGFHYDVVRRVQPPTVEAIGEDRDRTVDLGAGNAPPAMLAGDEPALQVAGIAVGVM